MGKKSHKDSHCCDGSSTHTRRCTTLITKTLISLTKSIEGQRLIATGFLLLSISIIAEATPGPRCRERPHLKTGRFRSINSHPSSEFRSTLKSYHSSRTSHRISWGLWYDWTTAQLRPNHSAFYTFSQVLIQRTHPSQPPTGKSEFASLENPTCGYWGHWL